jgi:microcompartment protein CcmL/EutN
MNESIVNPEEVSNSLEIPRVLKQLEDLLNWTQSLITEVSERIETVMLDADKVSDNNEYKMQLTTRTELGGFIDQQNQKLININENLRDMISRIQLSMKKDEKNDTLR